MMIMICRICIAILIIYICNMYIYKLEQRRLAIDIKILIKRNKIIKSLIEKA